MGASDIDNPTDGIEADAIDADQTDAGHVDAASRLRRVRRSPLTAAGLSFLWQPCSLFPPWLSFCGFSCRRSRVP